MVCGCRLMAGRFLPFWIQGNLCDPERPHERRLGLDPDPGDPGILSDDGFLRHHRIFQRHGSGQMGHKACVCHCSSLWSPGVLRHEPCKQPPGLSIYLWTHRRNLNRDALGDLHGLHSQMVCGQVLRHHVGHRLCRGTHGPVPLVVHYKGSPSRGGT